jgi:hypothetical protein
MPSQTDEIFLLEGEELHGLPARSLRSGLMGRSLEDGIHALLQRYPQLIPGKQLDPSSEDPPRFVLLGQEMGRGGSMNLLYVDQRGVLTLVEVQLGQSREARRTVIGQIVEYAAHAEALWGSGRARRAAARFWSRRGKNLYEVMRGQFKDVDVESLWQNVEANLRCGRVRLILAADELRAEARHMVEYLSREMKNAEVLGLELRCYGEEPARAVLVPCLVGQTPVAAEQEVRDRGDRLWTIDRLTGWFEGMAEAEGRRFQRLLDWAEDHDCFDASESRTPALGLRGRGGDVIVSVYAHGRPDVHLEARRYPGGVEERDALVNEFKRLRMFDWFMDPATADSPGQARRALWELDEREFGELLAVLDTFCGPGE